MVGTTEYEVQSIETLSAAYRCIEELTALGVWGARHHRFSDGRFGLQLDPEVVEKLVALLQEVQNA